MVDEHLETRVLLGAPARVGDVPTARALRRLERGVGDGAGGGEPRARRLLRQQHAEAEGAQKHDADEDEHRADAEVDGAAFHDGHRWPSRCRQGE